MDFSKIIVVSGKSGAFKVIAQSRSGFIAESLIDGKKLPISGNNRVTSIEDIVVFTEKEEVKLEEVLKKIKEFTKGETAIDHKVSDNEIKDFFQKILPEYDKERVYVSDMRKMVLWYNLLHKNNLLEFESEKEEETKEDNKKTGGSKSKKSENTENQENNEEKTTKKNTTKKSTSTKSTVNNPKQNTVKAKSTPKPTSAPKRSTTQNKAVKKGA